MTAERCCYYYYGRYGVVGSDSLGIVSGGGSSLPMQLLLLWTILRWKQGKLAYVGEKLPMIFVTCRQISPVIPNDF